MNCGGALHAGWRGASVGPAAGWRGASVGPAADTRSHQDELRGGSPRSSSEACAAGGAPVLGLQRTCVSEVVVEEEGL